MNRAQRLTLVVLGIADLLIISVLLGLVIKASRVNQQAFYGTGVQQMVVTPSACTFAILDALAPVGAEVSVAWDTPPTLTASGDGEAAADLSTLRRRAIISADFADTPANEGADPQIIWHVLDGLPPTLGDFCSIPMSVTILIIGRDSEGRVYRVYAADFDSEALLGWLRGELSDDELANRSRYRELDTGRYQG